MPPSDETVARFQQAEQLLERLIETLPKEAIAEVARMLAMNVVHYRRHFGEPPADGIIEGTDAPGRTDRLSDEMLSLAADGLEELAGLLGYVLQQQTRDQSDLH